jgi:hypothetical protein
MRVGPRCWYSGTPEPDRFKDDATGVALAVTLPHPGAEPVVERVQTGRFRWTRAEIALAPGVDAIAAIRAAEPPWRRADLLLSLILTGEVALAERAALFDFLRAMDHGLFHLRWDESRLGVRRAAADLDEIAAAGPLREAAESLLADAENPEAAPEARRAARDALDLLYGFTATGDRA